MKKVFNVSLQTINDAINFNWLRKARELSDGSFTILPIQVPQQRFEQLKNKLITADDYSERLAYCFMLAYALEKHHIVDAIQQIIYRRECFINELLEIEEALHVLFMYVTGETYFLHQEPLRKMAVEI